ncbi:MAG: hypothetical protein WAO98_06790 [Alphaproteobacteria bacterium]
MKLGAKFLICLGMFLTMPLLAQADTDYRCLQSCTAQGKTPYQCMEPCSYSRPLQQNQVNSAYISKSTNVITKHKVLEEAVPLGNQVVLKQSTVHQNPRRDYKCVAECLRNGMHYRLCNERCPDTSTQPLAYKNCKKITGCKN